MSSRVTTAYRVNLVSRVRAVGSHFLVFPHESTEYAFPGSNLQPVVAGSTGFDPLQDKILTAVLQQGCSSGSGAESSMPESALMLDIGAHVGVWSMLGLALGCRVIALEPYKESACYLQLGAQLNGWERRLALHNKLCSDVDGVIFNGWNGCVGDKACSKHAVSAGPAALFAPETVKVDDVADEDVLMLKMDIEGFEPHGLASARKLFARHRVSFVLIEVTWRINFQPVDGVGEFLAWFEEMSYRAHWIRYEIQLFPVPVLAWYDRIYNSTEFCPPTSAFCQSNLLFVHPEQSLPVEVEALVRNNGNLEFSSMIPLS
jgi:FkbM family methyltransferase